MADELHIDLERLRADLLALAEIGLEEKDHGLYRMAFTEADLQARRWLVDRLQDACAETRVDPAGNVIGRWPGPPDTPAVLLGSHIDTVPAGGILDGALGVLAGLECVRTLRASTVPLARPVELIAFADEEGRFGGMFGVEAFCGQLTAEWVRQAHDVDGVRLADAMRAQGLDPVAVLEAARQPKDVHAFIELHIEQGPVLEAEGLQIGIVESISGVFKWVVRLIGKANHAGTAPMNYRSDAFMGLADFAHEIPRIIEEDGTDRTRLTVGKAELKPGNPHTVPGEVEFSLVGRDTDHKIMKGVAHSCRKVLSAIARRHSLLFEFEELSWLEPHPCHPDIVGVFRQATERRGLSHRLMDSGAGHDTQFMAELTRAGMIFVPSVGGISHAPDEWTSWTDIENGAQVLLDALRALCS